MSWFCKHQWELVGKERLLRDSGRYIHEFTNEGWNKRPPTRVTVITHMCGKCRKYKQQTIIGWMTADQPYPTEVGIGK